MFAVVMEGHRSAVGTALLRAAAAEPAADLPRLVFADWLEEAGESDRAEFVRIQCALAHDDLVPSDRVRLLARERELWSSNGQDWTAEFGCFGVSAITFDRGLPHEVRIGPVEYRAAASQLLAAAPTLSSVAFDQTHRQSLALLSDLHLADGLDEVRFVVSPLGECGAAALTGCAWLSRVRRLGLAGCQLGPRGPGRLLASAALVAADPPRLEMLDLAFNGIWDQGVAELAESSTVRGLRELGLASNGISDGGAVALSRSPYLGRLESLDLNDNPITASGVRSLLGSPSLPALRILRVHGVNAAKR
ncbi:MAG: TIGR02996 domain-containing protein [Gemmataceae bacterium]